MNPIVVEKMKNFSLELYEPIFPRELDLGTPLEPKAGNLVTVITGMRRSGKSYRMFQVMADLIRSGVSADSLLYFDFEDDRLDPVTPQTGDEVLETFWSLHPETVEGGAYFFFDELQEMEGWWKWLRRVVDTTRATIFVSGSSSKMLSAEYATELRGRTLEYLLLPYSFREFVRYHHPDLDLDVAAFSTVDRLRLEQAFDRYLRRGGFPAVQDLSEAQAVSVLQGYAQRVVAKDVLERHNIGNPRAVLAFARKLLGLNGRMLSLRKTEHELKAAGSPIGRAMLADVLSYLAEAYLFFVVRERTRAVSLEKGTMVKAYPIDPGLARANAAAAVLDEGQSLEDAVCVELWRRLSVSRDEAVSFGRTMTKGYEIDFIAGDALFDEGLGLYQVTLSLDDPRTKERELRSLWEAMDERGATEGVIVVKEGKEQGFREGDRVIRCVPAWRWFLEGRCEASC